MASSNLNWQSKHFNQDVYNVIIHVVTRSGRRLVLKWVTRDLIACFVWGSKKWSWGVILEIFELFWDKRIVTHLAQLWIYLAAMTEYNIDIGSLVYTHLVQPWVNWCVWSKTLFLQVTINLLYHCSIESLWWLSSKVGEEGKIHNSYHGWCQILKLS